MVELSVSREANSAGLYRCHWFKQKACQFPSDFNPDLLLQGASADLIGSLNFYPAGFSIAQ